MPTPSTRAAKRRFWPMLEAAAWAMMLCIFVWIAWSGTETRMALRQASTRAIRVAELRGTLGTLYESLTMSVRMAAATGSQRWIERFDETSPKLAATVEEALTIASPEVAGALAATTQESWQGLQVMHQAAFRMVRDRDQAGAAALLSSTEYDYLEAVYQSGIDAFGADLMALAAERARSLDRRSWLEALALALCAVLAVGSLLAKRGNARLSAALRRTEAVARTDPLTGLPNRRKLMEDLQASTTGNQAAAGLALLMLDLDRFKAVNDAHGHPVGDHLLTSAAARLQATARAGDVVARLGGDEFAIIAPLVTTPLRSDDEAATHLVERMVAAFAAPFTLSNGAQVQVSASVGVAVRRGAGSVEEVVHQADVALYRAKAQGRNRFCFFQPELDEQVRTRARLEAELRDAIRAGVLVPHYQPLVDLQTGRVAAFEMLARWPRPDGTLVSPAAFIPVAETAGLIAELTEALMREACSTARDWPGDVTLACNVSPLLLRDGRFVETVRTLLAETGLPPGRLELEITESALVEDTALAGVLMRELKSLGVSLALDDFGTGFSSLRHLQSLPFDKLKIDAGFVSAMTADPESRTIVAAVIGLGQSLGLVTVAEGVETEPTAALLRQLGCDLGQGWLFGRPAAAAVPPPPVTPGSSRRPFRPDARCPGRPRPRGLGLARHNAQSSTGIVDFR